MNEKLEEFSIRAGEGTPYAATLTCLPLNDDDMQWRGFMTFDNDALNFPSPFPDYQGARRYFFVGWQYHRDVASGSFLTNLLIKWHEEMVVIFQNVIKEAADHE